MTTRPRHPTMKDRSSFPRQGGSRRNALCLLAFALLLFPLSAAAEEPHVLRLASDSWPPFTEGPERTRVAVELVHTALERAGIPSTTTIVDWKDVEAGIRDGDFDGSAAMWRTERREQTLLFSEPYLENRLVLVGRKGSDVAAARIAELAGKKVAAVGRYAYGDEIDSAVGVYFVNSRSDQDSLDKLLAGEVDYMLVDELVARYLMTYQPDEAAARLEIGRAPLARRSLHFVVRRDLPGAEGIITAFNDAIGEMLSDGTYAQVLRVGWIRVDVDGDGRDELVALGESIGQVPPGSVYDVFGEEPEEPVEEQRVFVAGSIYEGWAAVPERYKGPSGPMEPTFKHGTTLFSLQF